MIVTNMLATGANWLASRRKAVMSESVSVGNGRYTTSGIQATVGNTRKEQVVDPVGSTVETTITDFLIEAADYKLNGDAVKPAKDHVITRADGVKYKPVPLSANEPVWRWTTDVSRTTYRIHAIEVVN